MNKTDLLTLNFLECSNILIGHTHAVNCLVDLNGLIWSGSSDFTIRGWEPSGKCAKTLVGHQNWVRCLQVFQNTLFSGSADKDRTICQWDVNSEKCTMIYNEQTSLVRCLQAFNGVLYSGSIDHCIRGWSIETGKCTTVLTGHTNWVKCLQIIGNTLYSGGDDRSIRAWNLSNRTCSIVFTGHTSIVICLATNENKLYSGSRDKTIREWNIETGTCTGIFEGHLNDVNCLCMFGSVLYSGSDDKTIRGWDTVSKTCISVLNGHTNAVNCLLSFEGALYSGSADKTIRVWTNLSEQALEPLKAQFSKLLEERENKSELVTNIKNEHVQELRKIKDKIKKLKEDHKIELKKLSKELRHKTKETDVIGDFLLHEKYDTTFDEKDNKIKELEDNVASLKSENSIQAAQIADLTSIKEKWQALKSNDLFAMLTDKMVKLAQFNRNQNYDTKWYDQLSQSLLEENLNRNQYIKDLSTFDSIISESRECDSKMLLLQKKQQEISAGSSAQQPAANLIELIKERDKLREECFISTDLLSRQLQAMENKREERLASIDLISNSLESLYHNKSVPAAPVDNPMKTIEQVYEEYKNWRTSVIQFKHMRDETDRAIATLHSYFTKEADVLSNIKGNDNSSVLSLTNLGAFQLRQLSSEDKPLLQRITYKELFEMRSLSQRYQTISQDWKLSLDISAKVKELIAEKLEVEQKIVVVTKLQNSKKKKLKYLKSLESDDPERANLENTKTQLQNLDSQCIDLRKKQAELILQAQKYLNSGYPELEMHCSSSEHPQKIVNGLVVERALSDFTDLKPIPGTNNILLGKYDSKLWILKEFLLGNANDTSSYKRFEKEITILSKITHPLIIKIDSVFYEGYHGYLQMPYYERGTLAHWLSDNNNHNAKKEKELISIVYQIIQGIAFLHRSEIIHRDIKLENIYMKSDVHPIIADFDVSKDRTITTKSPTLLPGATEYLAPELTNFLHEATTASDMWAVGALVFKIFFPNSQLIPGKDHIIIPNHDLSDLRDLLEKLLKFTASERLSAEEALVHPLFSHTKMDTIRKVLSDLRKSRSSLPKALLNIETSNFIESITQSVSSLSTEHLLAILEVKLDGEHRIDQGAMVSAMYRKYFSLIFSSDLKLFEKTENGRHYLPIKGSITPQQEKMLEIFGTLLIRMIYDERTMSIPLAPSLFKFILDKSPTLRDLEIFDPEEYLSLQRLLALPNAQLCKLDFNGLKDNGASIQVTDVNKHEYVELKVKELLVECRKEGLSCVKKSVLNSIPELSSYFNALSPADLRLLLGEHEFVTAEMIKPLLEFKHFPEESSTPSLLVKWLESIAPLDLKRFLLFATEQETVPLDGLLNPNQNSPYRRDKITIIGKNDSDNIPRSHISFYLLEVPNYNNWEKLVSNMTLAIGASSVQ